METNLEFKNFELLIIDILELLNDSTVHGLHIYKVSNNTDSEELAIGMIVEHNDGHSWIVAHKDEEGENVFYNN
jgi:hypothetical protein